MAFMLTIPVDNNVTGERRFEKVTARRFTFDVDGAPYQFAVHKHVSDKKFRTVSHVETGLRAVDVAPSDRIAALGDDIAAARAALTRLLNWVGPERWRETIDRAVAAKTEQERAPRA